MKEEHQRHHQYKKQDWEKPHVIVFGQFPPYPQTPYGFKQNHNHYHYSLFGSRNPIANKMISDKNDDDQQQRNLIEQIQHSPRYQQFYHDFGSIRKVEYVKVEKEEVIQRVIQKVELYHFSDIFQIQVVQRQSQQFEKVDKSVQVQQKIEKPEPTPQVVKEQKEEIIAKQQEKTQEPLPKQQQTIQDPKPSQEIQPKFEFPDLSRYNPKNWALQWRYTGMLSLSVITFAIFRRQNLIPPIISIPKIRNALYISGVLGLAFSIPFFPEIKNLFCNRYNFIKRRFWRRNHRNQRCHWNRRNKYIAPDQFTFLSKGERQTNY